MNDSKAAVGEIQPAGSHALVVTADDERQAMILMDRNDLDQALAELRPVYIYALHDPCGEVRYIGQSVDPLQRLRDHLMSCHLKDGTYKSRWLARLLRSGQRPLLTVLEISNARDWRTAEARHIAAARQAGARLTNLTAGGDGTLGRRHSPASIAKMAAAKRGKPLTPEHRAHLSEGHRGIKRSPEAAAKAAAAIRGHGFTPEQLAKMSAAKKGRPLTPEHRRKLSAARKGKTFTPAHRAHLSASVKAAKAAKRDEAGQ